MHQTRKQVSKRIPITRKGTKYVVSTIGKKDLSVPILLAVRDMLNLASTAREVKEMIKRKVLKINGRTVYSFQEPVYLFNNISAGKNYVLTFLPTKKFVFEETKSNERLCKVVNKKLVGKNTVQINLHDGTNFVSSENISVGDSVYLDSSNKVKKHIPMEKAKEIMVISGKYLGQKGKLSSYKDGKVSIKLENGVETELDKSQIIAQ